ncbi:MAG: nucleotidyltransferase domain-containing protein [Caulobacterales bacterium]|nr:nucleotidyltransferase domain-containing protein [Caulobacterales bacterium]
MPLAELSNEQRRQFVDAQQAYAAWREASRAFSHSYHGRYAGSMYWAKSGGREYLRRKHKGMIQSLGPRSPETEAIKEEYVRQRDRYRRREKQLAGRLNEMAPVNRALRLDRVPKVAAGILGRLEKEGALGRDIFIVGAHALFAYEARAGVQLDSDIVATGDIDLLWDARRRLRLMSSRLRAAGVIGLLRDVDRSFSAGAAYGYCAVNDDGYYVDLICPQDKAYMKRVRNTVGDVEDDIEPAPIEGLEWLINAPKFEEIAIGEGGRPVPISCVDPRVFALHKMWLAARPDRQPLKRGRDIAQARAAAELAVRYFALDFKAKELSALPESLRATADDLLAHI